MLFMEKIWGSRTSFWVNQYVQTVTYLYTIKQIKTQFISSDMSQAPKEHWKRNIFLFEKMNSFQFLIIVYQSQFILAIPHSLLCNIKAYRIVVLNAN